MAQPQMPEECTMVIWSLLQLRQAILPRKNHGKHLLYCALPFFGFNWNITTEFRTLPLEYQGIGMKKWSIEKLAKDITTIIRHWQTDSTLGQVIQLVYESF
jgi:hypothetical protein